MVAEAVAGALRPGVVLVMRSGNDCRHDRAWSDIEWFIREGSLWRRRAWDGAPFFKDDPLIGPGCRTVYLARKKLPAKRASMPEE